tara:strand:+ start:217 stop:708 length:492 start_codon:yes stop_codon:yes gene_type:complete
MKKVLAALALLALSSPAYADMTTRMTSSVQLTVDSPSITTNRLGSTYSVSGNNITPSTVGGLGSLTSGSAVGYTPTSYGLTTDGDAYSFQESFIEGDAVGSSQTALTSGQIDQGVLYGNSTSFLGGTAGNLAGTIDTAGQLSLTAGGAGTSATGQFVTEVTIR